MPWPSNFEYVLGGVDVSILNVATPRADMRPHGKRLLDDLPKPETFLRSVAGVDSNDLMSSTFSLGSEYIEERAPGGVHDTICEMAVFHHPIDVQVLDGNVLILFSIPFGDLEMKVTALPLDLQMGLSRTLGSLPAVVTPLFAACNRALLASQGGLTLAVIAWVFNRMPLAIRQKGLQAHINPNVRMRTFAWRMFRLELRLTDDERIPVPISTQNEMGCLWGTFDGTVQLDLDGATELLGKRQVLSVRLKREIGFVLSQWDAMPAIGLFETREAHARDIVLFGGKKAFESLGEPVREHLHARGRNSLTTSSLKGNIQIILGGKGPILLILLFHGCQHVIVDMARFDETLHEQMRLCFLRIETILKRSHMLYFTSRL